MGACLGKVGPPKGGTTIDAAGDGKPHFQPQESYVGPPDGHYMQSSDGRFEQTASANIPMPEGVIRELKVQCIKVYDGDTLTCIADIPENDVPTDVRTLVLELKDAIKQGNRQESSSINRKMKDLGFNWEKRSDTIYRQFRVRVRGIDSPETDQAFGVVAGNYTRALCEGKQVVLRIFTTDQYGRTVADVITDEGKLLQHELLRAGMVWHYAKHDSRPEFRELEAEARAAQRGLWSESNPMPPWDYRRQKR